MRERNPGRTSLLVSGGGLATFGDDVFERLEGTHEEPAWQAHSRQYLYISTSKASKLRIGETSSSDSPASSSCVSSCTFVLVKQESPSTGHEAVVDEAEDDVHRAEIDKQLDGYPRLPPSQYLYSCTNKALVSK